MGCLTHHMHISMAPYITFVYLLLWMPQNSKPVAQVRDGLCLTKWAQVLKLLYSFAADLCLIYWAQQGKQVVCWSIAHQDQVIGRVAVVARHIQCHHALQERFRRLQWQSTNGMFAQLPTAAYRCI